MNRTFKAAAAALVLAVGFAGLAWWPERIAFSRGSGSVDGSGSVTAGPFEDIVAASAAYEKGDYATVLRLGRPFAEQGNAGAQLMLAYIYYHGLGVPKNYATAASTAAQRF
jgi:TPR repeat protein